MFSNIPEKLVFPNENVIFAEKSKTDYLWLSIFRKDSALT